MVRKAHHAIALVRTGTPRLSVRLLPHERVYVIVLLLRGRPWWEQLVVIVVDALRYDFVAPNSTVSLHPTDVEAEGSQRPAPGDGPHMPFVTRLLARRDGTAALFRFAADAPTVTAQRLKGLTTGSLPTFLEVRLNFASPAIEEDNWVHQLTAARSGYGEPGTSSWGPFGVCP